MMAIMGFTFFSLIAVAISLMFKMVDGATYSNATSTFSKAASDTHPTTTFSEIDGPYLAGYSYIWTQYIAPTTIGTIEIIINTDTNRTYTTTKTNTEFATNGTLSILTRTDVNAAGTVTAVEQDLFGYNVTVTYPTPIFALASELTWDAILPSAVNETSCCIGQRTYSPTPTHTPFISPTGAINSVDPSGWLYTLTGFSFGDAYVELSSSDITSLWSGRSIGISYAGCGYTMCDVSSESAAAASYAVAQAYLFATSTITTSGLDSSFAAEASAPSQSTVSRTGVEVDPITASLTSASSSTPSKASSVEVESVTASPTLTPTGSSVPVSTQSSVETDTGIASPTSPSLTVSTEAQSTPSLSVSSSVVTDATSISSAASTEPLGSTTAQSSATSVALLPSATPPETDSIETASNSETPVSHMAGSSLGETSAQAASSVASLVEPVSSQSAVGASLATVSETSSSTTSGNIASLIASGIGLMTTASTSANAAVGRSTTLITPQTESLGSTTSVSQAPATIAIGDATITADASSQFLVSGQTLVPGSSITIGDGSLNTFIALSTGPSETVLQVGTSVSTITRPGTIAPTNSAVPIVVGGSTITPDTSSQYIISGQTLVPGSSVTVSSESSTTVIALSTELSKTIMQIGSSASTIYETPIVPTTNSVLPIVVGGSTITPDGSSLYIVAGHTLAPGSTITVGSGPSAAIVALQTSDSQTLVVVGSSTSTLPQQQATPTVSSTPTALPQAFTIGSSIVSLNSASEYIIASQTLQPGGPAITVSGSLAISLATGATELIIGTSTLEVVATSQTGSGQGNIWSGATGADTASSSSVSPSGTVSSKSSVASSIEQSSGVGQSSSATAGSSAKTTSARSSGSRPQQDIWGRISILVIICLTILLNVL